MGAVWKGGIKINRTLHASARPSKGQPAPRKKPVATWGAFPYNADFLDKP